MYTYLFSNDVYFPKSRRHQPVLESGKIGSKSTWRRRRVSWLYLLQLPSVCRDLGREIGLMPYSMSLFHYSGGAGFLKWFEKLSECKRSSIQRLQISRHRDTQESLLEQLDVIDKLAASAIRELIVDFACMKSGKNVVNWSGNAPSGMRAIGRSASGMIADPDAKTISVNHRMPCLHGLC